MGKLVQNIVQVWQQRVSRNTLHLPSVFWGLGWLLTALAIWGFYEIAEGVLEQETQSFDREILLSLRSWHRPWLDPLMVAITRLGEPAILIAMSGALAGFFLWRKKTAETRMLILASGGGLLLNLWLKHLFLRDRPLLWQRTLDVGFYSFPSGHAMMSMVVYGAIGYLLASHYRHRWREIVLGTAVLIGAIGFSRLYLGVHWPTDVIAGYAAGMIWLILCSFGLRLWKRPRSNNFS